MSGKTIILILTVLVLASFVSANTVTIRPNGQGYRTAWTNVGCTSSNEWQCVDETSANTSDYLYNTGTSKETFLFSDTGLSSETINSVTLYYYAMWQTSSANACFAAMTRSGTTDYLSGAQLCFNDTYEYKSYTYTTNPATGYAWTVSEVDGLQAGMYGLNPNGGGRVAQVYAVVDYNMLDSCSDTDGYNAWTFGTISGYFSNLFYSYDDYCIDSSHVMEYYCSSSHKYNQSLTCYSTYGIYYCEGLDIYYNRTDSACDTGRCVWGTPYPVYVETCDIGCLNGNCTY